MQAYQCFEPYGEDPQSYTWSTLMVPEDCEDEVIDLLLEMQQRAKLTANWKLQMALQYTCEQSGLLKLTIVFLDWSRLFHLSKNRSRKCSMILTLSFYPMI